MLVPFKGELVIWMLLVIMLYPVLVMGLKDLPAGLLGVLVMASKTLNKHK
jgi:hypothetical protein